MSRLSLSAILAVLISLTGKVRAQPPEPTAPPSTTLERFDPLSPTEALSSFEIADGFHIELVACEPMVIDPVAFCFDARGRLLVVEMRGYSERPDEYLGRLRRLTDTDHDGRMDKVETLVEGLSWPTAVECWGEGIVVATAPDLLYFSEDGLQRRTLCSGFGTSNVQGLINSLRYGLDLRLHGATSSSGAVISGLGHTEPLRLGGRDFAIDTHTEYLDAIDGGGQHGMMIDAWGDKYVCSNSDHLQQVLLLPARKNRTYQLSFEPQRRRSIAADGPQAEVFRASPIEPWRILRTHLRVSGKAPGPIEGGGRAAGYFTGATGIWKYEDDQWPPSQQPVALICDVGGNLIHRKSLHQDGLFSSGVRIDSQNELVRSTDTWFRPVQLGSGPDGALYIADMYREVIEHPKSLPPLIKSQVDLNSGNDRGRIWRLVAHDRPLTRHRLDLTSLRSLDLIAAMDCKNAWQRRTAARLLLEKQTDELIDPLIKLISEGEFAEARVQSLMLLNAIATSKATNSERQKLVHPFATALKAAFRDPHPRVRQRAVEIAAEYDREFLRNLDPVWQSLAVDPSIFVRFQVALDAKALVEDDDARATLLFNIAAKDPENEYVRWAVEGSLGNAADEFMELLLETKQIPSPVRQNWLESTFYQVLRQQSDVDGEMAVSKLIRTLQSNQELRTEEDNVAVAVWSAVAKSADRAPQDGPNKQLVNWIEARVVPHLEAEINQATKMEAPVEKDLLNQKFRLVRWGAPEKASQLLKLCLDARQPAVVQRAAIEQLAGFDRASVETIASRISTLSPDIRTMALDKLSASKTGQPLLLEMVLNKALTRESIPERLWSEWTTDETIVRRLDDANLSRQMANGQAKLNDVVEHYRNQLNQAGNAENGLSVFKRHCATCHQAGVDGKQVGPPLKSVLEKSPEQILIAILDPNREVDPKYHTVRILTNFGKLVSGVVVQETDNRIDIADAQGTVHFIDRRDIESFVASTKSLMPEGFHENISASEMNDLIHFLRSHQEVQK